MTKHLDMNCRQFVVTTAAVGGGMAIGFGPPSGIGKAFAAAGDTEFGAFLVINADDTITVRVAAANVGNGAMTTVPMFVCEELHCDWSKVRSEGLSATRNLQDNKAYSTIYGNAKAQHRERDALLQAGASARERLKAAAAKRWNVPVSEITTKDSKLIHAASNRTLRYGEVAAEAVTIKLDAEPKIKTMAQWTFVGKAAPKVNGKRFVNGSAKYGIDVQVPGMLYAAVKQSPVQGGVLKSFNADAIKDRPGVVKVLAIGGPGKNTKFSPETFASKLENAVVVVADHFYNAKSALDVLPVEWEDGPNGKANTNEIMAEFRKKLNEPGMEAKKVGDAGAAMKSAVKVIEAVYETPLIDHALMEPMNSTVTYTPDRIDVWGSVKSPVTAQTIASEESGVPLDKIFVNTVDVDLGGDFGRRSKSEDLRQAVAIAMQIPGKPIKLIWTREEQMRNGVYRPMAVAKFQAGLDANGMPIAWYNNVVAQSYGLQQAAITNDPNAFKGIDTTSLASLANDMEYAFPNMRVEMHAMPSPVLVGHYRGPGHNQNPFMIEGFLDEVALAGGKDPVQLRRDLLKNAKDPGWLSVLNEVASKAQWGKPLPKGRAQGFAMNMRGGAQVAQIAEVSVSQGGEVTIHSIDVAFDVGNIMNPDGALSQVQGGVMFGVSDTLYPELTLRNGRVVEGNFDDYPMLRIADAPDVRVHFGGNTGGNKLGPIGEQGNMPTPGAICNAIFRACGKRVRSLPLRNHDLSWS